MAASNTSIKGAELSKAEYLKRYLSNDDDAKKSKGKLKKKRRKVPGKGLKIVDDDVDWRQTVAEENEVEEDDDEAPVIAEVIDERPDDVRMLEIFRSSSRWKVIGEDENKEDTIQSGDLPERSLGGKSRHDSPDASPLRRVRHDSPDMSPPRKNRHDSPDMSPPRKKRHDSPDMSPPRKKRHDSPDMSPPRKKRHDSPNMLPPRQHSGKSGKAQSAPVTRQGSDSDQSPPRKKQQKGRRDSDSDQSPPRRGRRGRNVSDDDLSPPRRTGQAEGNSMLSGGKAGLVSSDVLRKEKEEARRRDGNNKDLENASRHAQTVFRDKGGKKRDLESEREEQKRKAGEKAAKDEKYAQWGKGGQRFLNGIFTLHDFLNHFDFFFVLEKPRYRGPPPPLNRFNILPGYRWDGVNRSNGFEQKRYTRIADKKALQEEAYKWSVEDM
ncbi:BUD13 homolog [Hippocampus comes]|uniref:BUD13 homolog n=1 Tax=Hippocampus comes TaxID=109280 RepID=UPI00094E7DC2|nr:PREDICTED: BUD13 homolog [Hippocampus comes]